MAASEEQKSPQFNPFQTEEVKTSSQEDSKNFPFSNTGRKAHPIPGIGSAQDLIR